ncbi:MAG: AgmX/PglI C-terminal domain-containing protein [Myxococcales bacterium]
MADDSLAPPPPSQGGGTAKYLIALLLLLGGGLGVYFATRPPEAPPPPPPPPVKNADRSTALDNNVMAIPEDEPDAAAPVAEQQPVKKPRVAAGDPWECAGDVAPKDITKILNESQSAIRSCYERQLRNDNALQGDLKLQVKIGTDGAVASTRVRGSLNDKTVRECIQSIAKRWSFPAPTGGPCAVFDAPYNFMPKN